MGEGADPTGPHHTLHKTTSLGHPSSMLASLVAQRLKHPPAVWETWVWSLGREDPLEKEMATHSSFLVWRIPWTVEPGRLQSMGSQRVGHDWVTSLSFTFFPDNCCWLLVSCYLPIFWEGFEGSLLGYHHHLWWLECSQSSSLTVLRPLWLQW